TEVCPDATMLNYVNPMAMNTWVNVVEHGGTCGRFART
ncbi:hypothetical protein, partial [Pseudomonas aeruginosa]